ncbi:MAG TPA: VWA domain-containing protein [Gammaproteobacteria bacterium]|nr:VWA domain-containing protein [Gammaproteobacteria bacterium]
MATGFEVRALEKRYAFLDECPTSLVPAVVTLPIGTLDERVAGTRRWHDDLTDGRLPPPGTWPKAPIDIPVRQALESMGLVRFCKDQPELVEALMTDILSAFSRQNAQFRSEVAGRLHELEELERVRQVEAERARREKRATREVRLDDATMRRLREMAECEVANRDREADSEVVATWGERARAWSEIADVFGDLGEMLGRGSDMSIGVLKHTGWLDLLRLRQLVEKLPQLRDIVRSLGRLRLSHDGESVAETILIPVRRLEEERLEIRTPHVPAETRGIERSGEIARMLPVEAAMLGHPKLRLVWHARRAERALLTYRVEGVEVHRTWTEHEEMVEREGKRPRPERGPIIAVIDTSGSMHGLPEQVAKAIVLEAARTAHAEKRRCFLYAYSGPGQVIEHELDLSPEGIGRLLSFLGFSFGGGNDETGVMSKVISRLKENDWRKADIVFVSDGEWPAPAALIRSVEGARDEGTRFHGVQIGNRGRTGLHAICDPVHVFRDWATAGGWRQDLN